MTKAPVVRRHLALANGCNDDGSTPGPDHDLLQALSQLAMPTRWLCIKQEMARATRERKAVEKRHDFIRVPPSLFFSMARGCWQSLITSWRAAICYALVPLGTYLYGPSISVKVQRLPFSMYLKVSDVEWHRGLENELAALDLLQQQRTSIPVPRAFDLFVHDGESFLLSTRIPGMPLGHIMDLVPDEQLAAVVDDLRICVEQLRAVTRPAGSDERSVSGTSGGPCYDFRVISGMPMSDPVRDGDFTGPFDTELEVERELWESCY